MITIEQTLNILKQDQNFREVLVNGEYYYHLEGTSFDAISYDSRKVSASTSFLLKGPTSKKNTWNRLFLMELGFYVSKKIMKLVFPDHPRQLISNRP
mgnify:CR=1 FL=1